MKRGYRSKIYTFWHRLGIRWGRSSDGQWTDGDRRIGLVGCGIKRERRGYQMFLNAWEFGLWICWWAPMPAKQ